MKYPSDGCGPNCWYVTHRDVHGRVRLPMERVGVDQDFKLGDIEGALRLSFYPCGCLGEMFITCGTEGELVRGLLDGFATMFSIALQHGAPPEVLLSKCARMAFEPSGFTGDPKHPNAASILDYIAHLALGALGHIASRERHPIIDALKSESDG